MVLLNYGLHKKLKKTKRLIQLFINTDRYASKSYCVSYIISKWQLLDLSKYDLKDPLGISFKEVVLGLKWNNSIELC